MLLPKYQKTEKRPITQGASCIRFQFAPISPAHHPPQYPDNEPYSQVWYAQAITEESLAIRGFQHILGTASHLIAAY